MLCETQLTEIYYKNLGPTTLGATWAWVLLDERTPPVVVRCAGWMGLCVDGAWVGWKRGAMDLRTELPPGLHRVVLVDL